jgi:hypothetical protein
MTSTKENSLPEGLPSSVRNLLRLYLEKNLKNRRSDGKNLASPMPLPPTRPPPERLPRLKSAWS